MRSADIHAFLTAGLSGLGYGTTDKPMPAFSQGPWVDTRELSKTPQALVFAVLGNGAGLQTEGTFDRPFITIRVVGPQRDFVLAETLAYDIDRLMLSVGSNTVVGNSIALYITRTGGAPNLIDHDQADRFHFQCSYITETPVDNRSVVGVDPAAYTGHGAPPSNLGWRVGDFYIDLDTGDLYENGA